MDILQQLKDKDRLSREDIAALLKSIGEPGKSQKRKINAVKQLDHRNPQGIHIAETLNSYSEF